MTLYFADDEITTHGDCDDGWIWGTWLDRKGKSKSAWFWAMQLTVKPWGAYITA